MAVQIEAQTDQNSVNANVLLHPVWCYPRCKALNSIRRCPKPTMAPLASIENIPVQADSSPAKGEDKDKVVRRLVARIKELELELYGLRDSPDEAAGDSPAVCTYMSTWDLLAVVRAALHTIRMLHQSSHTHSVCQQAAGMGCLGACQTSSGAQGCLSTRASLSGMTVLHRCMLVLRK